MQQTTCGVIPKLKKTRVLNRKTIDIFLEKTLVDFKKFKNSKNCLYTKNHDLIDDPVANYLNVLSNNTHDNQLKYLLGKEYNKLESIYPKLGSIFIERYFSDDIEVKGSKYYLHKDNKSEFIDSLKCQEVKDITEFLFENASLEYNIAIEQTFNSDVTAIKTKNINFRVKYDSEFLGNKSKHTIKNFRYIIIDGMIESIGEIYHVLYKAAEEKEPYVIFCFGISNEVKDVIIQNNSKGITEIMPVCFKFDEDTINILNDLAILMGTDIVTAKLGQTISQEVSKELPLGKRIDLDRYGFVLTPNISDDKVSNHRKFLEKRITNSSNEKNKDLLIKRVRRMSSKTLTLYIPDILIKNNTFIRELDYVLRFFAQSSLVMKKIVSKTSSNVYYLPDDLLDIIDKSKNSLKDIFKNLDKLILYEE
jgi:hypothetical protein